ncbi:MAG: T9SS type A sorting domain-containing protein [Bacteroidia bacterium]
MHLKIVVVVISLLFSNLLASGQAFKDLNWHVRSEGSSHEGFKTLTLGPDGQTLVSGVFNGSDVNIGGIEAKLRGSVGNESFLALIDSSGNVSFVESFGSTALLFTDMSVAMDKAGDIFISGTFTSAPGPVMPYQIEFFDTTLSVVPNNYGGAYPFYAKVSNKGSVIWIHKINSPKVLFAKSLDLDDDGNVYIGGPFSSSIKSNDSTYYALDSSSTSFANDYFLLKVDSDGNDQWLKTFGSRERNNDLAISVSKTGDIYATGTWTGDTLFVGSKFLVNPKPEIGANPNGWHAKFNTDGDVQWLVRHSDEDATANDIKVNPAGGFITSVYSNAPLVLNDVTYETGYTIMRYNEEGVYQSAFHINGPEAMEIFPEVYAFPNRFFMVQEDGSVTIAIDFSEETITVGETVIENNAGDFGSSDIVFTKINTDNDVDWVHHIGASESEVVGSVAYYKNNIILVGSTTSPLLKITDDTEILNSGTLTADFFILSFQNKVSSSIKLAENVDLDIYPNPIEDMVNINLQNFNHKVTCELIDINGSTLHSEQITGGISQIDLSSYPKGVYFISVSNETFMHTEKLIVK